MKPVEFVAFFVLAGIATSGIALELREGYKPRPLEDSRGYLILDGRDGPTDHDTTVKNLIVRIIAATAAGPAIVDISGSDLAIVKEANAYLESRGYTCVLIGERDGHSAWYYSAS